MYSKKLLELFRHPHNYGRIENADGVGKVGQPICGDVMAMYINVSNNKIKKIKFETFGCAAAISTSSIITDMAKGKTLANALKISNTAVAKELGGLPPIKMHCSNLAADALHEAIYDYMKKHEMKIPASLEKEHERIVKYRSIAEHRH